MTDTFFSPPNPPSDDRLDELLSAMLDGEITLAERAELDRQAHDRDTTVEALVAPFRTVQSALQRELSLSDSAASNGPGSSSQDSVRARHIAAAMAAAQSPEVVSIAAARATPAPSTTDESASVSTLDRRVRRQRILTSVAAGLVLVAGIGFLSRQGEGITNDSASEVASDDFGSANESLEAETFDLDGADDDASFDDPSLTASGSMAQGSEDAMSEEDDAPAQDDDGAGDGAMAAASSPPDSLGVGAIEIQVVSDPANAEFLSLTDLASQQLSDAGARDAVQEPSAFLQCILDADDERTLTYISDSAPIQIDATGIAIVEVDQVISEAIQSEEGLILLDPLTCLPRN